MNAEQFDALRKLIRMRDGPATLAARRVLVDGAKNADAARHAGCTPSSAADAVRRLLDALVLARVAAKSAE